MGEVGAGEVSEGFGGGFDEVGSAEEMGVLAREERALCTEDHLNMVRRAG